MQRLCTKQKREQPMIRRRECNGGGNKVGGSIDRTAGALKQIGLSHTQFTILIGSRARRTQNSTSDIDVVRIGHLKPAKIGSRFRNQPISYTDYDIDTFLDLYERGSLFLYHIFKEGKLLEGSAEAWQWLKDHFRVRTDFKEDISRNRRFLQWLLKGTKYNGAVVPYLAHACRALKNLAIFSLAQNREYVFDKRAALRKAFPQLSDDVIALLVDASNRFERLSSPGLSRRFVDYDKIGRLNRQLALAVKPRRLHDR